MSANSIYSLVQSSRIKYPDGSDPSKYVECKICGYRSADIGRHINHWHKTNSREYTNLYNTKVKAPYLIEKMMGKNNPGYNHKGRLSPFSKNNQIGVNAEEIKEKAKKTRDKSNSYQSRKEYWIKKGYSDVEAKIKVRERQTTFSLEKCVEKYGETKGKAVWEKRQKKWQNTLNSKSDAEIADINKRKTKNIVNRKVSNAEKEIKTILEERGYAVISQFYLKNEKNGYYYDIKVGNKIIEYNGDFWHANPLFYKHDEIMNFYKKVTASEKWEQDRQKINMARSNGYEVMVVWENDYNNNKEKCIEKCLNFLKM